MLFFINLLFCVDICYIVYNLLILKLLYKERHYGMKKTALTAIILICLFLAGCQIDDNYQSEKISEDSYEIEDTNVNISIEDVSPSALPVFFVDSLEASKSADEFAIDKYYCKNRKTVLNQYMIDENQVLWGYGHNEFGQLGNGQIDTSEAIYTEPVKIAENVVSVDASGNGFFAIFLTEDGNLYGMGSNRLGLLGQPYETCYSDNDYSKVTEPVLLMQNVVYASAGMKSIVALKQDGSVWWWGEYSSSHIILLFFCC